LLYGFDNSSAFWNNSRGQFTSLIQPIKWSRWVWRVSLIRLMKVTSFEKEGGWNVLELNSDNWQQLWNWIIISDRFESEWVNLIQSEKAKKDSPAKS
jgi:hypothetical protein